MSTVVHGAPVEGADKECARCRRRTMAKAQWRSHTTTERRTLLSRGVASRGGRGLCEGCYRWAFENGRLIDYERVNQRTADVVEEWQHMADPLRPLREEIRRLAPRLGMVEKTLEQALHRGGIRSRYEGGHGERVKAA